MSWRRLKLLIDRLPLESEYKTALRNDTDLSALPEPEPGRFGPWPQTDMLLAQLVDLAQRWMWANADPEKRPPSPPRPYPRPGVEQTNVHPISPEAAAYMEYVREHRRHPPDDWTPEVG